MGMFDSLYDENGVEWQTKAYDCYCTHYQLGDRMPGGATTYQVEILGGSHGGENRDSLATIRAGHLEAINVPRDPDLFLIGYYGGPG